MPKRIWTLFPLWFHIRPQHGYPSEQIVRLALQYQQTVNLANSRPNRLSAKLLAGKVTPP